MVFTLQRYARPDYDFEWFYSMANIVNWSNVVSGKKPPEELGAKKVDDYTFTVTTDSAHALPGKIFADLWVSPKHIVKDRLNDGSWAFDKNNWVFAGPYKLEKLDQGQGHGVGRQRQVHRPLPAQMDKIIVTFMDPGRGALQRLQER